MVTGFSLVSLASSLCSDTCPYTRAQHNRGTVTSLFHHLEWCTCNDLMRGHAAQPSEAKKHAETGHDHPLGPQFTTDPATSLDLRVCKHHLHAGRRLRGAAWLQFENPGLTHINLQDRSQDGIVISDRELNFNPLRPSRGFPPPAGALVPGPFPLRF